MGSIWDDRLAEVWASPDHAGAGVVLGRDGVLTARHLIADVLAENEGSILARIVRPGRSVASWAPMQVRWDDPTWDLALLRLDTNSDEAAPWEAPASSEPVFVELGMSVERDCEAVGFPETDVERSDADGPGDVVRQPKQVAGVASPVTHGKPVTNDAPNPPPERSFPLTVDTTAPQTAPDWGGMSGAGVILPDGRLIGTIVSAERGAEPRNLYLVPLADVLTRAPDLDQELTELTGEPPRVKARAAPLYERVCMKGSLGKDGLPQLIDEIADLGVFGVKPADLPDEATYLEYVPRDEDENLHTALIEAKESHRLLLVVGASGAGKSRSSAEAARELLADHRLIRPREGEWSLSAVSDLPLVDDGPALVWLDDIQNYAHPAMRDTLSRLQQPGVVLVGTIRQAAVDQITTPGDIRNPTGESLDDDRLVRQISWALGWEPDERARLAERVSYPPLLEAVAKGSAVGAYLVAGPDLVRLVEKARRTEAETDEPNYALARSVIDWYRTGVNQPIPCAIASDLIKELFDESVTDADIDAAVSWATTPVIGGGRKTRQSILALDDKTQTLAVHDYVIDYAQRHSESAVPRAIWEAALNHANEANLGLLGNSAYYAAEYEIARRAFEPVAAAGNSDAMFNLGVLLKDSDPEAARSWYEKAAAAGQSSAMFNLGVLFMNSDPEAMWSWWEQAAAAGHSGGMYNLGERLKDSDPEAAQRWWEQAAAAGHGPAMFNLGVLLKDSDTEAARSWWEQAAAAGVSDAMFNLGALLTDSDPEAARGWYEQAAAAGVSDAMFNLWLLLKDSDPEAAQRWWERAAWAGHGGGAGWRMTVPGTSDPETGSGKN